MTIARSQSPIDHRQMKLPHKVACLIFDGAQVLDATGPLEVFARTDRWLRDNGLIQGSGYQVELVSLGNSAVAMSSGLKLFAERNIYTIDDVDTLFVAGGIGISKLLNDDRLQQRIRQLAGKVERIASVCTGAFLLAEAGLLKNRKVTTHWNHTQEFKRRYPEADLQIDLIFCKDEHLYSSGGVSAGIDLALSLVQEDFGQKVALAVAKELVLYLKRPGGQNQFSTVLSSQVEDTSPLHKVVQWISEHYMDPIHVPDLAAMATMSPRNFSRRFAEESGFSPAKFVERVRVEHAMRLLEETDLRMESIASRCGISSADQLGQIFNRVLQVSPKFYRMRFR